MRKRKSLEEKQAEKKRIEKFHQEQYNCRLKKKAEEINKVMVKANYIEFNHNTDQYTLKFKNGQVFKFSPYFPCVFHENKIVPVLED